MVMRIKLQSLIPFYSKKILSAQTAFCKGYVVNDLNLKGSYNEVNKMAKMESVVNDLNLKGSYNNNPEMSIVENVVNDLNLKGSYNGYFNYAA